MSNYREGRHILRKKKSILIVDDSQINREIISEILRPDYYIVEAESGAEALQLLETSRSGIDAILLDIVMPEMNGYEFLAAVKKNKALSQIPIIVLTEKSDIESEKKALECGAWDFVPKPYNADIVKLRLKNVLARSQMPFLEQLHKINNYDSLTGLYSKNKFFSEARQLIDSHPDVEFVFIRMDIDRFKLINSFFGNANGDRLLKYVAENTRSFCKDVPLTVFGRVEADVFGVVTPFQGYELSKEIIEFTIANINKKNTSYNIVFVYGMYVVEDRKLPIAQMCDRAAMAAKTVKGNYIKSYAYYDENMRLALENEQNIINEMSDALANGQFMPYYQPKYDVRTNRPVGAEALARWIHPTKGFISPGVFIPIFEKNGFISKLDFYMWECVCKQLKEWKERGIPLFPVSVNVSRVNLYNPNLVDLIVDLLKKYDVDPKYFNLEITESVYTDENIMIDDVTNKLHEKGFTILMDDFGSGYSSLNVLKDVQVDVLKLDMKFMFKAKYEGRAETIIASVVRMAKWLNIPIIAEGVDKREQVEFLRGLGCEYIQGFYFAKPMPVEEYEALISKQEEYISNDKHGFNGEEFWKPNGNATIAINSILQPAVVVEYFANGTADTVSVNKAFNEEFGFASDLYGKYNMLTSVDKEFSGVFKNAIEEAYRTKNAAECTYSMHNAGGRKLWLNVHFRYVNETDTSVILIAFINDVTNTKIIDDHISEYQAFLKTELARTFNILVVSENAEKRDRLESILAGDYNVFKCVSKEEGLEILKHQHIDMIYYDIKLYENEDEEFPFNIKTDDGRIIPVIIITSTHGELESHEELKTMAWDFVMPPFVAEMLRSRTANLLNVNINNMANAKYLNNL